MAHSLAEIENDALRLPPEDRARLAVDLLASFEGSVESPEEIEKLWLAEAERRFLELRDRSGSGNTGSRSLRSTWSKSAILRTHLPLNSGAVFEDRPSACIGL